jgi:hypothetical protein
MHDLASGHHEKQMIDKTPDKCGHDFSNITLGDIQNLSKMTKPSLTSNELPSLVLDFDNVTLTPVKMGHHHMSGAIEVMTGAHNHGQFIEIPALSSHAAFHVASDLAALIAENPNPNAAGHTDIPSGAASAETPPVTDAQVTNTSGASAEMAAHTEEGTLDYYLEGASNVIGAVYDGCVTQIEEHPLEVALAVASSIAIATVAVATAPVVAAGLAGVGIAVSAAELLTVAGAVGTVVTATNVAEHAGEWFDAAAVVAHPEGHTITEFASAHHSLNGLSNFVVDFATGLIDGPGSAPHASTPHLRGFDKEMTPESEEEKEKKAGAK